MEDAVIFTTKDDGLAVAIDRDSIESVMDCSDFVSIGAKSGDRIHVAESFEEVWEEINGDECECQEPVVADGEVICRDADELWYRAEAWLSDCEHADEEKIARVRDFRCGVDGMLAIPAVTQYQALELGLADEDLQLFFSKDDEDEEEE